MSVAKHIINNALAQINFVFTSGMTLGYFHYL